MPLHIALLVKHTNILDQSPNTGVAPTCVERLEGRSDVAKLLLESGCEILELPNPDNNLYKNTVNKVIASIIANVCKGSCEYFNINKRKFAIEAQKDRKKMSELALHLIFNSNDEEFNSIYNEFVQSNDDLNHFAKLIDQASLDMNDSLIKFTNDALHKMFKKAAGMTMSRCFDPIASIIDDVARSGQFEMEKCIKINNLISYLKQYELSQDGSSFILKTKSTSQQGLSAEATSSDMGLDDATNLDDMQSVALSGENHDDVNSLL
jgi:hypothetical protein